ncbi:hypothetical protein EYF80_026180 [Liparis tanakae]|uniref:Uncharacterized protein n=1 Tax=Liparis tanakae TaxID=230148 RepID=A0A4Z2HFF0_9TELE|nr:hypothetical protein EYF80_026180 [Liparis tanakae]
MFCWKFWALERISAQPWKPWAWAKSAAVSPLAFLMLHNEKDELALEGEVFQTKSVKVTELCEATVTKNREVRQGVTLQVRA